jgi:hypothetical protein
MLWTCYEITEKSFLNVWCMLKYWFHAVWASRFPWQDRNAWLTVAVYFRRTSTSRSLWPSAACSGGSWAFYRLQVLGFFFLYCCLLGAGVACQYGIWLQTGRPGLDPQQGQSIFPVASMSRPGPTQPPVQWVPGVLFPGVKRGRDVTLTTYPHLVPRSWMSRGYTPLPPKRLHGV